MKGKDEVTTHSVSFIVADNRRLDEIRKMLEAQGVKNLGSSRNRVGDL